MDNTKNLKTNSMAEIFINLLSFILLGITATAAGSLYFQIINRYFPDILSLTYQNYQVGSYNVSLIRYAIASLIVGLPIYLWAMRFWFLSFKRDSRKSESRLSKWLTYIVLLIAGGTIIGDFITILYNFLQGEYGARFMLKALVILVIACLVFGFYFIERKRVQYKKEINKFYFYAFAVLTSVIAILAIVFGFIVSGTPQEARLRNLDAQRVSNLEQLSSCINNFSYDNGKLPANFSDLKSNSRYYYCALTSDPETGKDYEYKIISANQYEICADFSFSTVNEFPTDGYYSVWSKHDKGTVCNTQTVTFSSLQKPIPLKTP